MYFEIYQKGMFYVSQFAGEYGKIGRFINETLMIATYLTVKGTDVKPIHIIGLYLFIILFAAIIGKILVAIGVADYNNRLANAYNPEIQKIVKDLEAIKKHLNIRE